MDLTSRVELSDLTADLRRRPVGVRGSHERAL
jgi:hypothetical protein